MVALKLLVFVALAIAVSCEVPSLPSRPPIPAPSPCRLFLFHTMLRILNKSGRTLYVSYHGDFRLQQTLIWNKWIASLWVMQHTICSVTYKYQAVHLTVLFSP